MNETFEVGEVAIFWKPGTLSHGQEVIVKSPLKRLCFQVPNGTPHYAMGYYISGAGLVGPAGAKFGAESHELRKRKPPEQKREQLGEWELCPWRPTQVTERA